jgi:hypothetical protein
VFVVLGVRVAWRLRNRGATEAEDIARACRFRVLVVTLLAARMIVLVVMMVLVIRLMDGLAFVESIHVSPSGRRSKPGASHNVLADGSATLSPPFSAAMEED